MNHSIPNEDSFLFVVFDDRILHSPDQATPLDVISEINAHRAWKTFQAEWGGHDVVLCAYRMDGYDLIGRPIPVQSLDALLLATSKRRPS